MSRAKKEAVLEAKALAQKGYDAVSIADKTGVCIATAKSLINSFSPNAKYPEPPVTVRQMNDEEITKYGLPKNQIISKPAEVIKPKEKATDKSETKKEEAANSELSCPRKVEITSGPIAVGMAAREVEFAVRSLRYLKVKNVEIIIRSVEG